MKMLQSEKELYITKDKSRIYLYYSNDTQTLLYKISEELTKNFNEIDVNVSNVNLYKINYNSLNIDLKKGNL